MKELFFIVPGLMIATVGVAYSLGAFSTQPVANNNSNRLMFYDLDQEYYGGGKRTRGNKKTKRHNK